MFSFPPVHIDAKESPLPDPPKLTSPVPLGGFQIRFAGSSVSERLWFVETEDLSGNGIAVGEWKHDGDDWLLIFEPGQ